MLDLVKCKSGNLEWRAGMMEGTLDFKLKDGHCRANVGIGRDWMTVYLIETEEGFRNRGEATRLLKRLKKEAEESKPRRELALWCPMGQAIEHICEKLHIKIYDEDDWHEYKEM